MRLCLETQSDVEKNTLLLLIHHRSVILKSLSYWHRTECWVLSLNLFTDIVQYSSSPYDLYTAPTAPFFQRLQSINRAINSPFVNDDYCPSFIAVHFLPFHTGTIPILIPFAILSRDLKKAKASSLSCCWIFSVLPIILASLAPCTWHTGFWTVCLTHRSRGLMLGAFGYRVTLYAGSCDMALRRSHQVIRMAYAIDQYWSLQA